MTIYYGATLATVGGLSFGLLARGASAADSWLTTSLLLLLHHRLAKLIKVKTIGKNKNIFPVLVGVLPHIIIGWSYTCGINDCIFIILLHGLRESESIFNLTRYMNRVLHNQIYMKNQIRQNKIKPTNLWFDEQISDLHNLWYILYHGRCGGETIYIYIYLMDGGWQKKNHMLLFQAVQHNDRLLLYMRSNKALYTIKYQYTILTTLKKKKKGPHVYIHILFILF